MKVEHAYPIFFILCTAIGALIGHVSGHGAIRGLTIGMSIAALPLFLVTIGYLIWTKWRPDLPDCRCGQCTSRGYRYVGQDGPNQAERRLEFQCPKCGRTYEFSGTRFNELSPDGRFVPYMSHSKWGRWKKAPAGRSSAKETRDNLA